MIPKASSGESARTTQRAVARSPMTKTSVRTRTTKCSIRPICAQFLGLATPALFELTHYQLAAGVESRERSSWRKKLAKKNKKENGPRCLMHREALGLRLRASRERHFAKDVWISAAHVATLHARPMRLRSRYEFEFLAVQISGLPGNDRPLTHTVTLHPARS